MSLHITMHAIERYQERVANVPDEAARAAIDTPAVRTAAKIGAPYVKLSAGQRIVLAGETIVTVLEPQKAGAWAWRNHRREA